MLLGTAAHAFGWPFVRGGSQALADALVAYLQSLGGEVITEHRVSSLAELPEARAVLFDLTPRQILAICGDELGGRYRRSLEHYRYGPGVFKLDWALSAPIPWKQSACGARAPSTSAGRWRRSPRARPLVWRRRAPRAALRAAGPAQPLRPHPRPGRQAHRLGLLPRPQRVDLRHDRPHRGPGRALRPRLPRRHRGAQRRWRPADMERHDANYIGGDINAGVQDYRQLFTRPAVRPNPYTTPNPRLFICSSSTPPGRRRPRDVRLLRRQVRPQARPRVSVRTRLRSPA